jgi:Pyruvate kinase, barrel domain
MSVSNTIVGSAGPELRGGNITLETILRPTDVSLRQTKIVCTLGPACWEVPMLEALIDAGMAIGTYLFVCVECRCVMSKLCDDFGMWLR